MSSKESVHVAVVLERHHLLPKVVNATITFNDRADFAVFCARDIGMDEIADLIEKEVTNAIRLAERRER